MKPLNKEQDGKAAKAALGLGYAGLALLWVWRMIHPSSAKALDKQPGKQGATWVAKLTGKLNVWAQRQEETADPAAPEAPRKDLPSLSLSTPGYASLDQVARYAAAEADLPTEPLPPFDRKPRSWQSDSPAMLEVLAHQRLESPRLEGWNEPRPGKLPVPTFAPAIMAFGIIMFAMGLATTWYVCLVGSLIFTLAAWRWTAELQEE